MVSISTEQLRILRRKEKPEKKAKKAEGYHARTVWSDKPKDEDGKDEEEKGYTESE